MAPVLYLLPTPQAAIITAVDLSHVKSLRTLLQILSAFTSGGLGGHAWQCFLPPTSSLSPGAFEAIMGLAQPLGCTLVAGALLLLTRHIAVQYLSRKSARARQQALPSLAVTPRGQVSGASSP